MKDEPRHYHLLENSIPNEEKLIRTSVVMPIVLVVAASTALFVVLGIVKGATAFVIPVGLIMVAYMAFLTVWYPHRLRQQSEKHRETYDLEIGNDYLTRRQANLPDLRLPFDEVQAVERVQGRDLRVIGTAKSQVIVIPEAIEHFEQVLETLSSVHPIRVRTAQPRWRLRAMAAGLLVYITMIWSTSPIVVIPLSLAMSLVLVWAFFWIQRNPNIPLSRKRIAWIYWLFFVVCVLKLFVAVSSYRPQQAARSAIVGSLLLFSPSVLLIVGWVGWWRLRSPRYWRNYVIASGLAATSISALCLYGVLACVRLAHIGYANEHRLAMAGVYVGWPLSVLSVAAAFAGEGRSRVMLCLAAWSLATVWTFAFYYA